MVELLINDISNLIGPPVSVGDMNKDILKQNNLSCKNLICMQYNGMTQLLSTATRITIDALTLIDQVFHHHFSDNPDCGILDAGLADYCSTFANFPFFCMKYDDTGVHMKFFLF